MAPDLRLVVNNDAAALAAGRKLAADAWVGARGSAKAGPLKGGATAAVASPPVVSPEPFSTPVLSGTSHLALSVAALALVSPEAAAADGNADLNPAAAVDSSSVPAPASGASGEPGSNPAQPAAPAEADGGPANVLQSAPAGSPQDPLLADPNAATGAVQGKAKQSSDHADPPAHRGSSTSPDILQINTADDELFSVNSPAAPVTFFPQPLFAPDHAGAADGSGALTTFAFIGNQEPEQVASLSGDGTAAGTVDFSDLVIVAPATQIQIKIKKVAADGTSHGQGSHADGLIHQLSAGNGIYVNLSGHDAPAAGANGRETIQVWQLDGDGIAVAPLAHIENIDNVAGTVGNDFIVGNDNANTFIYTATDDRVTDASGAISIGAQASYGFDIYIGGTSAGGDQADTLDFSWLGPAEGAGAGSTLNFAVALLPHEATGIAVDLQDSVTVIMPDPMTGLSIEITGSLVSTGGGSQAVDLALLVWAEQPDRFGDMVSASTIENIVGSHGADTVAGDGNANTYTVTGDGSAGPSYFDGRGGIDTIDFSRLNVIGVDVHLNQTREMTDGQGEDHRDVSAASSATGDADTIVLLVNVENVVGSHGDDTIEGDRNDNVLTGGGGADAFVFRGFAIVDGRLISNIGHDAIRDFDSGSCSHHGHDTIVFSTALFDFIGEHSGQDRVEALLDLFGRDDQAGLLLQFDNDNSIRLDNFRLTDVRGDDDGSTSLRLSFYDSFVFA